MNQANQAGEFIFSFPLWVLAHEPTGRQGAGASQLLLAECADRRLAVHFFTDEDLAERFARSHPGSAPRAVETVEDATRLLDSLDAVGCGHFSFDAPNENRVLPLPIDMLRQALKQFPPSRSD